MFALTTAMEKSADQEDSAFVSHNNMTLIAALIM